MCTLKIRRVNKIKYIFKKKNREKPQQPIPIYTTFINHRERFSQKITSVKQLNEIGDLCISTKTYAMTIVDSYETVILTDGAFQPADYDLFMRFE
jgi:hypothetical protein